LSLTLGLVKDEDIPSEGLNERIGMNEFRRLSLSGDRVFSFLINLMKSLQIIVEVPTSLTKQQQQGLMIGGRLSVRETPSPRQCERENKRMSQQIVV
jgi:hypothetical protein